MPATRILVIALWGLLVGVSAALWRAPAGALVFTVDSVADGADANTFDMTCADLAGQCTLRAAIQQANATMGRDTIAFAIPPLDGSAKILGPHDPLPPLARALMSCAARLNFSSLIDGNAPALA